MPPAFDIIRPVPVDLRTNLESVRAKIRNAAAKAGRSADEIKLVAVSKTHPPSMIADAISAGVSVFGENKVQEAEGKIIETRGLQLHYQVDMDWHYRETERRWTSLNDRSSWRELRLQDGVQFTKVMHF